MNLPQELDAAFTMLTDATSDFYDIKLAIEQPAQARKHFGEFCRNVDSLKSRLDAILTAAQREKALEEFSTQH